MLRYNTEDAFFSINSPTTNNAYLENSDFQKDVISVSVTEEINKIVKGTISFKDNLNIYSDIFRTGVKFNLAWGLKRNPFQAVRQIASLAPNEAQSITNSRYLNCFFVSPSGGGDEGGRIIYNMTFYGTYGFKGKEVQVYDSGNRKAMIQDVFANQLSAKTSYIEFDSGDVSLGNRTVVSQNSSPFKFIKKQAEKDRAIFGFGYNKKGNLSGFYVDFNKINSPGVQKIINGWTSTNSGSSNSMVYNIQRDGYNSVSSYTWKKNIGESGTGSNVRIFTIDGQPTYFRSVAGQQKAQAFRMDTKKQAEYLKKNPSLSALNDLITKDFDTLVEERFFIPVTVTSAPEGFGLECTYKMPRANPNASQARTVKFFDGFPSELSNPKAPTLYTKTVNHTISKAGYKQTISVADAFTITGGSFIGVNSGKVTT